MAGTGDKLDPLWGNLRSATGTDDRESASVRTWAETLALRAAAFVQLDRTEAALDELDRVITLLVTTGLRSPYTLLPRASRLALSDAAQEAGRATMSPELLVELTAAPSVWPEGVAVIRLTEREKVVLRRLVRGGSTAEMAGDLFASANTVKSQLRSLYRKLKVTSRDQALLAAGEQNLLD